MRKVKQILALFREAAFVFSPAKTGSTSVVHALGTSGHAHSFFVDRVFFYNDVKFASLAILINKLMFTMVLALCGLKNALTGTKTIIFVPLRDDKSRLESLFRDLLLPLTSRYYHDKNYRIVHHSEKKVVFNFYRSKIQSHGFRLWCDCFGFPYQDMNEISTTNTGRLLVISKFSSVKILVFNIQSLGDLEFRQRVLDLGIELKPSSARNKSADLWYASLFNAE